MSFLAITGVAWLSILLLLVAAARAMSGQWVRPTLGLFGVPLLLALVAALFIEFFDYFFLAFATVQGAILLFVILGSLCLVILAPAAAIEWFINKLRERRKRRALKPVIEPPNNGNA